MECNNLPIAVPVANVVDVANVVAVNEQPIIQQSKRSLSNQVTSNIILSQNNIMSESKRIKKKVNKVHKRVEDTHKRIEKQMSELFK